MKLNDLRPAEGSRRSSKRVGRGHGSGRGKTAGRGTKGQKARGKLPAWFEGGQTPLHIRTPKLPGFKNRFRVEYSPVNLTSLSASERGTLVTPAVMEHAGLIRNERRPVKILGVGDAPAGITIHAHAFSRSALDKLAAAGSSVQRLSWPGNDPIELTEPPSEEPAEKRGKKARRRAAAASAQDEDAEGPAKAEGGEGGGDSAEAAGDAGEGERAEPEPES